MQWGHPRDNDHYFWSRETYFSQQICHSFLVKFGVARQHFESMVHEYNEMFHDKITLSVTIHPH